MSYGHKVFAYDRICLYHNFLYSGILILRDKCDILSGKRLIGVAKQGNTIVYGNPMYNNPFELSDNRQIAVNIINDRNIGSLEIIGIE